MLNTNLQNKLLCHLSLFVA